MKKLLSILCSAVMLAGALTGCNSKKDDEDGDTKNNGNFTVSFENIAEDMGAGWNLGNTLEANAGGTPSETAWGNPEAAQEMIDAVAEAGFNTIRVPVSYLSKIDDSNNYTIDSAWLDRIQEVVDYCYKADLYVIINIHGDGYNSINGGWLLVNGEDQAKIQEKYKAVWKQIAERFKDYDEHLIFESMNEVFDGEYNDPMAERYANLNTYNQIFVDTVRETAGNNTHRWLLVPGWNTNIDYTVGDYGFELPTDTKCTADENRIMVSVHYYDPWDYCGTESIKTYLWGKKGQELIDTYNFTPKALASWGDETHLETQMTKLKTEYIDNKIPVIIGEYGAIDKKTAVAGFEEQIASNRVYFNSYVAGTAASMGITPVYWDNGYNGNYGFGLFDRKTTEQTQPEIISGIVKAVAEKNPLAGSDIKADSQVAEKSDEVHAYIGVQTNVYTFRNAYDDATYGASSEWFDTLIKWGDTNNDGKNDDIIDTGATFTDASIKESGTYTVSVEGYDFSQDSDSLNMLFVSTDFPYSNTVGIKDVVLYCDDKEYAIEKPYIMADGSGNMYIELVNIYNTEITPIEIEMPTESFKISFNITGVENMIG